MSPWMVWVDACAVDWFDSHEKQWVAVLWTGNAFRQKTCISSWPSGFLPQNIAVSSFLIEISLVFIYRCYLIYLAHMIVTSTGISHPLHPRDGWERRGIAQTPSLPRWRGWEHRAWYNDLWGHFPPTPKWPRSTCPPETKCPSAETKSFGPATRGWNLNCPRWRGSLVLWESIESDGKRSMGFAAGHWQHLSWFPRWPSVCSRSPSALCIYRCFQAALALVRADSPKPAQSPCKPPVQLHSKGLPWPSS